MGGKCSINDTRHHAVAGVRRVWLVKKTDPLGRRVELGYDAEGNPTTATAIDRFGHVDNDERATRTTLPGPAGLVERRVYDDAGRLTGIGAYRSRLPVKHPPLALREQDRRSWSGE